MLAQSCYWQRSAALPTNLLLRGPKSGVTCGTEDCPAALATSTAGGKDNI